jgi:telomerase reverse transcriptase
VKRYVQHSKAAGEVASFEKLVRDKFSKSKSNTVFVDTAMQQYETRDNLLQLLREHVERNLVKFGKKFYRQKKGIPQGSILSSILCNFFYAELEREELSFALTEDSLLMRLLDDFLLITLHQGHAEQFIKVMHHGHPKYGVSVKGEKSMANFDVQTGDGHNVAKPVSDSRFPYCGVLIDTTTLEVSKNSDRSGRGTVADSLTVDVSKLPGQTFHRKALNGFKIQLQAMFIDTSLNSVPTVLANLYQSLADSAERCFEYVRVLSRARTTHPRLVIKTVERIIALAFVMLQRRTRTRASENAARLRQAISHRQIQWIACKAFDSVFRRRQTQHGALLAWLAGALAAASPRTAAERCLLEGAVVAGRAAGGPVDAAQ